MMMTLEIAELVVGVEKFRNLLKFFVIKPFAGYLPPACKLVR